MGAMPVLLRLSTRTRDRLVSHRHLLKNQLQHRRSSSGKSTKPTETSIPVPNHIGPLPFWQRLGPLTRLASGYARAQKRRPYVTQLCSSLTIYFLGDLGAQWLSEDEEWDPKRTMRSLVIGGVSSIPSYKW
jgi:dihydroorotate dehydrogenase